MKIIHLSLVLLLLIFIIFWFLASEQFWQGPSFDSVASGSPVNYRKPVTGVYSIRRWRNLVPDQSYILGPPRQVTDNVWDRTYNSGIGFQMG